MTETTPQGFEKLWTIQEHFYQDRELMRFANANVPLLLGRIVEEADECKEAIEKCTQSASVSECVDLMTQDIRQEVADLFLFVMALARCIGLNSQQVIEDATEKVARNICRYPSANFSDTTKDFPDQIEQSRSWDKRRGFTTDFYQRAA